MDRACGRQSDAKAVDASREGNRAIPVAVRSCGRSNKWMRWWSLSRMIAAVAASFCRMRIRNPLHHQVIKIPAITPLVIEHSLLLVCPCCSTSTCAALSADVEASHYEPRLSALVGLLGSAFPLRFNKTKALLAQLLGVEIPTIRQHLSAALERPVEQAIAFARQKPVAYSDENGAPCQATSKTEPPATRIEAIPPESRAGNGSW